MNTRWKVRGGVALAFLMLGATACGSDDENSSTNTTAAGATTVAGSGTTAAAVTTVPATVAAGNPAIDTNTDPDAVVQVGYAGPPLGLDPARARLADQPYQFLLFDRLTAVNDALEPLPMLATSWEFAADGSSLTLTLRDDVTFHDDSPLDAAAVKASLDRARTLEGSTAAPQLDGISSVDVVDAVTVKLNLAPGKGADLPIMLATAAGQIINPKVIADPTVDLSQNVPTEAGSGPYVLKSFKASEVVEFTRAPKYWDETAGLAAGMVVTFIAAASARLNGVQSGQLDVAQITGADVKNAQDVVQSGAINGEEVWVLTGQHLFLRADRSQFADIRVRQALNFAIDREAIGTGLLSGNCRPSNQYYGPDSPYYSEDAEIYTYDPERARELLADAGASDLTFELAFSAGSSFELPAQAIQQQLQEVGVTVNLRPGPGSELDPAFRRGELDAYMGTLSNGVHPNALLGGLFYAGYNVALADPTLKALSDQGLDPKKTPAEQAAVYQDVFARVSEQALYVNVCQTRQLWAWNDDVVNGAEIGWTFSGLPDLRSLGKQP